MHLGTRAGASHAHLARAEDAWPNWGAAERLAAGASMLALLWLSAWDESL